MSKTITSLTKMERRELEKECSKMFSFILDTIETTAEVDYACTTYGYKGTKYMTDEELRHNAWELKMNMEEVKVLYNI